MKDRNYLEIFGKEPDIAVRAPGRINLIGEHTDYNKGFVLPVAIDRQITLTLGRRADKKAVIFCGNLGEKVSLDLSQNSYDSKRTWSNYPRGVIQSLILEGSELGGFNAFFRGDIPMGVGLGSSAAVEVAFAYGLDQLFGLSLERKKMAILCQKAENSFVGVNCGVMDQFISFLGRKDHALLLDCQSLEYKYIRLNLKNFRLVIIDTGIKRELQDTRYNTRRNECEQGVKAISKCLKAINSLREVSLLEFNNIKDFIPKNLRMRSQHVIEENKRVKLCSRLLEKNDLQSFGRLMVRSHQSLSDLFEVSCNELDFIVEKLRKDPGVLGARMTGAGFGGCAIALIKEDHIESIVPELSGEYRKRYSTEPRFYLINASEGASRI
ncbi:MAG: galactokinase [Deltaproteobacteria bacterium]|nr:MAG: galactokinase [Deltaproteobacteria bacterium]